MYYKLLTSGPKFDFYRYIGILGKVYSDLEYNCAM